MAVNAADKPCTVTFKLDHKLPARVAALFENRTAPANGKKLKVDFKPFEARVFQIAEE